MDRVGDKTLRIGIGQTTFRLRPTRRPNERTISDVGSDAELGKDCAIAMGMVRPGLRKSEFHVMQVNVTVTVQVAAGPVTARTDIREEDVQVSLVHRTIQIHITRKSGDQ